MVAQLQEKEALNMATNQVTHLNRHPQEQHPSNGSPDLPAGVPDMPMPPVRNNRSLIHYALDEEQPPVIACGKHDGDYSTLAANVTCPDCKRADQFPISAVNRRTDEDRPLIRQDPSEPPIIRAYDVLMQAADLLTGDDNPDYDRAIIDFTRLLIGGGPDDTILMTRILRSLAQGE